MTTRKLITKVTNSGASTYIGNAGEIFYDTATATLKLSDGVTPGGQAFTGGGSATWPVTNTNGLFGPSKIAIGASAGITAQGTRAVALGYAAGSTTQGASSVAIGESAGSATQGADAVAIGQNTGYASQGVGAVAVGAGAGQTGQGDSAVAIGLLAGDTVQAANSIVLNATGTSLNQTTANTFTVKPVRNGGTSGTMAGNGFHAVYYNSTTGEFVYTSS
jgi:hypothetical protein